MSSIPQFTMRELMDAGVHYGHKTMRWNPQMAPYIFGERNNIHIINLQKTVPLLHKALEKVHEVASSNGRILFVSTKRQASPIVAEAAKRCGQYYVNHRWLGGMLTNWKTISQSIQTLRDYRAQLEDAELIISKKERLQIERKAEKLVLALGGIKDMSGLPSLIFVIDTGKEHIAIKEAQNLGIPVVGIVDSNANPNGIVHIIPGNDDAIRSIQLYCNLVSDTVLAGLQQAVGAAPNSDAGEALEAPTEAAVNSANEKTVAVEGKGEVKVEAKKKKVAAAPKAEDAA